MPLLIATRMATNVHGSTLNLKLLGLNHSSSYLIFPWVYLLGTKRHNDVEGSSLRRVWIVYKRLQLYNLNDCMCINSSDWIRDQLSECSQ